MRLKKLLNPQKVWAHLKYLNPIRPRRYLNLVQERWAKVRLEWAKAKLEYIYINPTHHSWYSVYKRFAILKIGLLNSNPTQQDLSPFYEKASPRELDLVQEALAEIKAQRYA